MIAVSLTCKQKRHLTVKSQNQSAPQIKTDGKDIPSTHTVADFTGIGCFDGVFLLGVKEGSWPYQVPPRMAAYALQEPPKKELERLQS